MKTGHDILVIDDEPVVRQSVERICGSEDLSVDTVTSGGAGLERLGKHTYRMILCDIMMEDMDGFQFLAESVRRGNRAPVVMTTGYSTGEHAIRSLQCGAIDYLAKPFTADELMAVVRRALNFSSPPAGDTEAPPVTGPHPPHFHRLGCVSWAETKPEGTVLIGVNDLFVRTMKGMRSVVLSPVGTNLIQGTGCATIISADGLAHGVMCPVSGQVIEAHTEVAAHPSTIEQDPYGAGWLYRILPSDLDYSLRCLTAGLVSTDQLQENRKGESPWLSAS
jgi:CheY-like chemotaxis protein/glycine cleavage system H lipoate-binding protein